jgi:regulator of sirC expression with transglutaminase-like and TPR domain
MQLMQRPEEVMPLDEAALLIAAHANPTLDVKAELDRLDGIAGRVGEPEVEAVCRVLFEDIGLRGDHEDYDDPRNSYLDQVLARRLGIPISLSVVLLEIGGRCGLRLEGVGMPGHFLVRDPARPDWLIDAFNRGRQLDRSGCERLLQSVAGAGARLSEAMLATTGRRAILARMLANLDRSFERRNDTRSLLWVCTLRAGIPGLTVTDRHHIAARLGSLGRFDTAADVLETLACEQSAGDIRARLEAEAASWRAQLN